ncbi:MAG: 3-oxoacyl-ACP synthase III, partial [Planctomycetia bacterium]|nr:3-oxoacyl-ACP synthase III [Planctomycetia bacterium]
MQYRNVCIESLGYTLPSEIVTSDDIERQLQPLYQRLRLPEGRLELMTGIRERRFWEPNTLPSDKSVESGKKAIANAGIDPSQIGALIHGSVCRDHLEPATACRVHHHLGLASDCVIYDVSNACLGLLNGMIQVANMIELGQIRAGLVVGTESGRQLVETTIETLNRDETLSRSQLKMAVASLTIGSGSCAILLTDR